MLRTGIETIICLSPNFLYVYVYVYVYYHDNSKLCASIPTKVGL